MSKPTATPNLANDHAARAARRLMELIDMYLRGIAQRGAGEPGDYVATLIARSPASPVAGALAAKADELSARQVSVRFVFAKPAPPEALDEFLSAVRPALRGESVSTRVRWARNPGLLDAHEQLTLGASVCWSGDAMRRSPQRPGAVDLVEVNAPDAVRRAVMSFSAVWTASQPLNNSHLRGDRRKIFDSLSEMAMAVHHRESGGVTIPSIGEDTTRH